MTMNLKRLSQVLAAALLAASVPFASAQSVVLSLDVFYSGNNAANAGTWQLRATASNNGLAGLDTQLTGITGVGTTVFKAPTPAFKTTFGAKPYDTDQDNNAATKDMLFGQVPVAAPGPQDLIYTAGVTGDAADFEAVDLLNNATPDVDKSGVAINNNVLLAFGRFAAGGNPQIAAGQTAANVFTATGTATNPPAVGSIVAATVTTQRRTNIATRAGDFNLDRVVNGLDIGPLVSNFNGTNRLWQQGDANGDLVVNGLDIGPLVSSFGGPDPGAAPLNAVKAQYNRFTGEIKLSVNQVLNWVLQNADGTAAFNIANLTLPPVSGGLETRDPAVVGIGVFAPPGQNFVDRSLGRIAQPGLGANSLFVSYEAQFGSPTVKVPVEVIVPEPATIVMMGLVCAAAVARRRAA